MDSIEKLFYELAEEASNSNVVIGSENFYIGFNTVIYDKFDKVLFSKLNDKNFNTLVIKNKEEFFSLLRECLSLDINLDRNKSALKYRSNLEKVKFLMSWLFVNASSFDFLNPCLYLKRYISYFKDDSFNNELELDFSNVMDGIVLKIRKDSQSFMMETPNKMRFIFENKEDGKEVFSLPSISYGITDVNRERECYIYSIINDNKTLENNYSKKLKRILRKVDKGIDKNSILKDVNYLAVVSLTLFLTMLKLNNISNVRSISLLPVRFLSRDIASKDAINFSRKDDLSDRNRAIQINATDKFLKTFMRAAYSNLGINVLSNPLLYGDDIMNIRLDCNQIGSNNDFLNGIINKLLEVSLNNSKRITKN